MGRLLGAIRSLIRRAPAAHRTGRKGERAAERRLRRKGYTILARRWRTPAGEIDLLVARGARAWLVEVKTTASPGIPTPRVRPGQRRRLERARGWCRRQPALRRFTLGIAHARVRLDRRPVVVVLRFNVHAARKRR